jgi:hypothetical protein
MKRLRMGILFWVGMLPFCFALLAQEIVKATSIMLEVKDQTGAGIPNAHVTIVPSPNDVREKLSTSSDGKLSLDVPLGSYDVTVESPGFAKVTKRVEVKILMPQTIDIALEVRPCSPCPMVTDVPSDLRVELRSTSGSNRFKVGEPIELEAIFSSKAAGRYLEPCGLFGKPNIKPNFGFPLCRFYTRWSLTIKPDNGWTDIRDFETKGGPRFEVPNCDLSSIPASYSYMLTDAYSFNEPGEYRVTLTVTVGLDDKSTQRPPGANPGANPHFVTLTPEIVLRIVAKS